MAILKFHAKRWGQESLVSFNCFENSPVCFLVIEWNIHFSLKLIKDMHDADLAL